MQQVLYVESKQIYIYIDELLPIIRTVGSKVVHFSARNSKILKICSQGYIFRILQHFATKFGNCTNLRIHFILFSWIKI
jgi:hypothetical protein